ncbi:hypothetical protein OS493_040141, partial [Desmophyllum pertusum]
INWSLYNRHRCGNRIRYRKQCNKKQFEWREKSAEQRLKQEQEQQWTCRYPEEGMLSRSRLTVHGLAGA